LVHDVNPTKTCQADTYLTDSNIRAKEEKMAYGRLSYADEGRLSYADPDEVPQSGGGPDREGRAPPGNLGQKRPTTGSPGPSWDKKQKH
jgi:hypothetical protein